jgi:SARP family transcriptional regulator, regulator of embCAB operon
MRHDPKGSSWDRWELCLLGGFQLRSGATVAVVTRVEERLLAFLALQTRAVTREFVAASLWLATDEAKAMANLRTAVWRVRKVAPDIVAATRDRIALAAHLRIDLLRARAAVDQFTTSPGALPPPDAIRLLDRDLLPDWYDDWVTVERERFRQSRLHALEAATRTLTGARRFPEAIEAAELAVAADPLRESAHRVLIEAHIAEGNWAEALRQYERARCVLADELGLRPTPRLAALVAPAALAEVDAPVREVARGGGPSPRSRRY